LLGLGLLSWGLSAQALGLGPLQMRSALGEPLRMRIAVSAASMEEVGCVVVKPHGDDLPVPPSIRSQVVTTDRGLFIELTTLQPINDPALELIVTAGCAGAISREYVLLLDPAPLVPAVAEAETTTGGVSAVETRPAVPRAPSRPRQAPTARAAAPNTSASPTPSATSQPTPSAAAPPVRSATRPTPSTAAAVNAKPNPAGQANTAGSTGRGDALRVTAPEPRAAATPAKANEPDAPLASTSNLPGTGNAGAGAAAAGASASPGSDAAAREQALEKQLQLLSTQVEALREQMRTVSERNRELESKAPKSIYTWLMGALALLALLIAAWFAWSYRVLQRKSAARPWFEQTQMGTISPETRPGRREFSPREEALDEPEFTGTDGIEATEMLASDPFGGAAALVRPPVSPPTSPSAPASSPASSPRPAPPAPSRFPTSAEAEALARARALAQSAASAPAPIAPPAPPAPPIAPLLAQAPEESHPDEAIESLLGISTVGLQRSNPGSQDASRETPPAPKPEAGKKDQRPLEAILDIDLSKTEAVSDLRDSVVDAMNPLDFELPALNLTKTEDKGPKEIAAASPRMIDLRNTSGLDLTPIDPTPAEHASVQFRLTQFASVVDRAKEMQRSGDPTKAIALLREYVLRDDLSPTMIWLMLFDLYRMADKKPVYDALAENFERRYKRPMVPWQEPLARKTPQSPLALNQELDLRINSLWGTHEGIDLLRDLTCGVDQPDRIVFNAELQRDLLQLAKVFPIDDTE
jgi:hypothetical protein